MALVPPPAPLSIEEIESMSELQLRVEASRCFSHLKFCDADARAGVLAQAEFYMRELERRKNAEVAARDYRMAEEDRRTNAVTAARDLIMAERSHTMEVWVIWLIGAELVLSVLGIIYGYIESGKQQKVLDAMDTSTGYTATAMKDAAASLKTLSDDQKTANGNVQANLKQTSAMATALQQQLNILKQQQADRLAELSKKPKLELFAGEGMLNLLTAPPVPVPFQEQTDTSQSFILHLRNGGTASALNGSLRVVIFAPDVQLLGTPTFQLVVDESNGQQHAYIYDFPRLRPGINIPILAAFTFPKGRGPFGVVFNVDDDEADSGTFLGALTIVPRK